MACFSPKPKSGPQIYLAQNISTEKREISREEILLLTDTTYETFWTAQNGEIGRYKGDLSALLQKDTLTAIEKMEILMQMTTRNSNGLKAFNTEIHPRYFELDRPYEILHNPIPGKWKENFLNELNLESDLAIYPYSGSRTKAGNYLITFVQDGHTSNHFILAIYNVEGNLQKRLYLEYSDGDSAPIFRTQWLSREDLHFQHFRYQAGPDHYDTLMMEYQLDAEGDLNVLDSVYHPAREP